MKVRNIKLVLYVMVIALSGCKNSGEKLPQAKTIKYVKVETIGEKNTLAQTSFNGKIKEKTLTSLSFRVGGPLTKLNVKQGDFVRAGQVIAEIDQRDYELQLETTKAQFTQLESEYKRYKTLVEQDKIPANTYEKIESGYLMAKTSYENAQNQLKDTKLKAPFSGYIYEKDVENFQTVGAGTTIVSLIDNSKLEAIISVPESQLQMVKENNGGLLTVENAGVCDLPVKLFSVSEKTMQDGLYEVKFSFDNNKGTHIAPGMTAEVAIVKESKSDKISIPNSAIFHQGKNTFVWIYSPSTQKITKRSVAVSLDGKKGNMAVLSGLKAGEKIVTAGVHYLVEGQEVKPIKKQSGTNVGGLL